MDEARPHSPLRAPRASLWTSPSPTHGAEPSPCCMVPPHHLGSPAHKVHGPPRPPPPQEVLKGSYTELADVWSCGVVLYVLLCGQPPFVAERDEDVFKLILDDGVPNM